MPAVDGDADDQRSDEAAEVSQRVHEAGDDAGVIRRDVDRHRPAGAKREIRRRQRERQRDRLGGGPA